MYIEVSNKVRIQYLIRTIEQIKENGQMPSEHLVDLLHELQVKELQTLNTEEDGH